MEYERTPYIEKSGALEGLESDDDTFARALRSAAMFLAPEDFDDVLAAAIARPPSPFQWWAILESIIIAVQARRIFPANAEEIIRRVPDDPLTDGSRDEARILVTREGF
jgi:hypothetical protein